MNINQRRNTAFNLCIVSGILLLIAGGTSVSIIFKILFDWLDEVAPDAAGILGPIMLILVFLAAIGGILVMLAGVMFKKGKTGAGKILIFLGVGMGIVGLIFYFIVLAQEMSFAGGLVVIMWLTGIILSVVAKMMAK